MLFIICRPQIVNDIVKIAVSNDGRALQFVSDKLKNNYDIVKLAVNSKGYYTYNL